MLAVGVSAHPVVRLGDDLELSAVFTLVSVKSPQERYQGKAAPSRLVMPAIPYFCPITRG